MSIYLLSGGGGGPTEIPVAIADGGTGAATEATARENLGLEIGVDVEAYVKDNYAAAVDPTVNNDSSQGYAPGSKWFNVSGTPDEAFICSDATVGAAQWHKITVDAADLGTMAVQNANAVSISGGTVAGITDLAVADGGTGASDASTARSNLGLGTIATQAANNVAVTGGAISGITDLAVADGGTGASDAANARSNLGLDSMATQASNNVSITGGAIGGCTITGGATAAVNYAIQTTGLTPFVAKSRRVLYLDPNLPEVAGYRYQTYADAVTYITGLETPSWFKRWEVIASHSGSSITADITLSPFIYLVGSGGSNTRQAVIVGNIYTSTTASSGDEFQCRNIVVGSVDPKGALWIDNVYVTAQITTAQTGSVIMTNNSIVYTATNPNCSSITKWWVYEGCYLRLSKVSDVEVAAGGQFEIFNSGAYAYVVTLRGGLFTLYSDATVRQLTMTNCARMTSYSSASIRTLTITHSSATTSNLFQSFITTSNVTVGNNATMNLKDSIINTNVTLGTTGSGVLTDTRTLQDNTVVNWGTDTNLQRIAAGVLGTNGALTATNIVQPNILINSNGKSPINQRAIADGTAITTGGYTADRWKVAHDCTTVNYRETATGFGITVATAGAGSFAEFIQSIEAFAEYAGKTLILTARVKSNAAVKLAIYDGVSSAASAAHTGGGAFENLSVSYTVNGSPTQLWAAVDITTGIADTKYLEVEWVKLENGSVATTWQVPDPAEEMGRCGRYGLALKGNAAIGMRANGLAGVQYYLSFALPVTMRDAPVATILGTWAVGNSSQPSVAGTSANTLFLAATTTADGDAYAYCDSADDGVFLDAEIS